MEEKIPECLLFEGLSREETGRMLVLLGSRKVRLERGEYVLRAGDPAGAIGLVLSGGVQVFREDYWGNRSIVARGGEGELFAEAFALSGAGRMPVSVAAVAASEILLFDASGILEGGTDGGPAQRKLMGNLLRMVAARSVLLSQKVGHLSRRTTREKLLSYLSSQASMAGSNSFLIPFDRQELADYLSVDRSALSRELGRLREEGLLDFSKNRFTLAEPPKT